jgi:hypothetical protein
MSNSQNLAYAVVQVLHNFGAVATVAGSFAAIRITNLDTRKKLAWFTLAGWGTQAVSGASFGLVSFYFYRQFPDIAGIAVAALVVKMVCVALGFTLLAAYLFFGLNWSEERKSGAWLASFALAFTALSAAAFLRWFS